MTDEQMVADAVRALAERQAPGDRDLAERAAALALHCYRAGSTVSEACWRTSTFIESWISHPAHLRDEDAAVRTLRLVV